MEKILLVLVWFSFIFVISYILAIINIKSQKKKKAEKHKVLKEKYKNKENSVEQNMYNLKIESPSIIPTRVLQTRGSWRLAQNSVMSYKTFRKQVELEYREKL